VRSLADLRQAHAPLFSEQLADDGLRPGEFRPGGKWCQGIRGERVIERRRVVSGRRREVGWCQSWPTLPRYRGSGGFLHWAGSGGFPTGDGLRLVGFPALAPVGVSRTGFLFLGGSPRVRSASRFRYYSRLFDRLDFPPIIRSVLVRAGMAVGQPIPCWLTVPRVSRTALARDLHKA
jgi:hypothetical protein